MKARWQVFLGALVLVPIATVIAAPTEHTAGAAVGGLVLVLLVAVLAFRVWADLVLYFGYGTGDDEQSESASGDAQDRTPHVQCPGCGAPIPPGRDSCEDCTTVGSWRK